MPSSDDSRAMAGSCCAPSVARGGAARSAGGAPSADGPDSAASADGPGSASPPEHPGASPSADDPGSALPADGPGPAPSAVVPGSALPADGPGPAPSAEALAVAAPTEQVRTRAQHALPIPAGPFRMGAEDPDRNPHDGEAPVRRVEVPAFRIDAACVTNAEFAAFVAATGHVTEAEEFGWSFVFGALLPAQLRRASRKPPGTPWWRAVEGARWDRPEGPGSSVAGRGDHPVVHVSLRDAEAFARWCGMRLPTEAEWEKAARGGLDQARYAWGDELTPGGEHRCNIWQGAFPVRNTLEDGHLGTAPVRSYPPNGLGLYEVAGNVWEWCSDAWTTGRAESLSGDVRVMRGGSYLCHDSYCNRYRVAARSATAAEDASGNKGFRLAADA